MKSWIEKKTQLTPPVSPKVFSKSGGVRMSLPITDSLNPGAYLSITSNTEDKIEKISCYIFNLTLEAFWVISENVWAFRVYLIEYRKR